MSSEEEEEEDVMKMTDAHCDRCYTRPYLVGICPATLTSYSEHALRVGQLYTHESHL